MLVVDKKIELFGFDDLLQVQIPKLQEDTYYIVEVAYDKKTPLHRSIMMTKEHVDGLLEAVIFNGDYEEPADIIIEEVYYLKVIQELPMKVDLNATSFVPAPEKVLVLESEPLVLASEEDTQDFPQLIL